MVYAVDIPARTFRPEACESPLFYHPHNQQP
jgi:hypothetical protein